MANKSMRFCNHHGCNILISTGSYCEAHAALHIVDRNYGRVSASDRGYDHQWHKAQQAFLRAHPLCDKCEQAGITEPSTMAHHIIPLKQGGARLNWNNLRALCFTCHEIVEGRKKT